ACASSVALSVEPRDLECLDVDALQAAQIDHDLLLAVRSIATERVNAADCAEDVVHRFPPELVVGLCVACEQPELRGEHRDHTPPTRLQMEQLHTPAPVRSAWTSKRTFPQWHEPALLVHRHRCLRRETRSGARTGIVKARQSGSR